MSVHKYKTITTRAEQIKSEVLKHAEIKHNKAWSYFHAKTILQPKKDLKKIPIKQAKEDNTGDKFKNETLRVYSSNLNGASEYTIVITDYN